MVLPVAGVSSDIWQGKMSVVCLVCSATITAISYGTALRLTYITLPLIARPSYRNITDWIVYQKTRYRKCVKN